jgi:hypothetical protein
VGRALKQLTTVSYQPQGMTEAPAKGLIDNAAVAPTFIRSWISEARSAVGGSAQCVRESARAQSGREPVKLPGWDTLYLTYTSLPTRISSSHTHKNATPPVTFSSWTKPWTTLEFFSVT